MEMLERTNFSGDGILSPLVNLRKFLYLVQPGECSYERIQDVPYYFAEVRILRSLRLMVNTFSAF